MTMPVSPSMRRVRPPPVGVEDGAVGIRPDADFDGVDLGLGGLDALLAHAGDAGARDGGDDAGLAIDPTDTEAVLLADVEVAMNVYVDGVRHEGGRLGGGAAVTVRGAPGRCRGRS